MMASLDNPNRLLLICIFSCHVLADGTPYQAPGINGVFSLPDFPPPQMSESCMANSFSSPFWIVNHFHRSAEGRLEFDLKNAMDGSVAHCERGAKSDYCSGDNYSQFDFDLESKSLVLKQRWSCDDQSPGNARKFLGLGTGSMRLACNEDGCTAPPTSISASLLEPVQITPVVPPPPPGHGSPNCTSRSSQTTAWVISNWTWRTESVYPCFMAFCPPAIWSYVNFFVTNPITNATASCKLEFGFLLGGLGAVRQIKTDCVHETYYYNGYNYFTAVIVNDWNEPDRFVSLSIAQQWYCDDEGATKPYQFTQFGMRNITREIASNGTFPITSSHVVDNPMEPHALEFPKNVQSCTVDSFTPGKPTFRVQDIYGGISWFLITYDNATATHRTGRGTMLTTAHNLAQPNRLIYCQAFGDYLNPNLTHPPYAPEKNPMICGTTSDEIDPKNHQGEILRSYMSYDNRTNVMTLHNHTWSCWDKDPKHTIVFASSGAQKINKMFECGQYTSYTGEWDWECTISERVRTTNISLEENMKWDVQNRQV